MPKPEIIHRSDHQDELNRIRQVYNGRYRTKARDRAYAWHPRNPVSLFYRQSLENNLIDLFNKHNLLIENYRTLDVGCGIGNNIRFLVTLQANPNHLFGLDLMPYRIITARQASPDSVNYMIGDAAHLPYVSCSFDMVTQFTVFSSVLDNDMRYRIASEMCRVVCRGGYILWYDLTTPQQAITRGVDLPEILSLFSGCRVISAKKLHSRFTSRLAPRSQLLAGIWDRLPGIPKTHYLALLQQDVPN